jgi:ATP-dependent RNA circularization protein (DNA/RNA ligase family)
LDGSNGSVRLGADGELLLTSRARVLSEEFDNQNFFATFSSDERFVKYLTKHPTHVLFGEWIYTRGVLKYTADITGKFMVFDVMDAATGEYLPPETYVGELDNFAIDRIPIIEKVVNPQPEDIMKVLAEHKSGWNSEGEFEGIVLKNYEFRNKYGRQTFGKIVRDEWKEIQADRRTRAVIEDLEQDIIDTFLTAAFIKKEFSKIENFDKSRIGELLGRIWHALITEEAWHIIKKYKNPTVNFARLNNLTIQKIKQVLAEYF